MSDTPTQFKPGDPVEYHIRGDVWLPGVVRKVSEKRVVVQLDGHRSPRVTLMKNLRPRRSE